MPVRTSAGRERAASRDPDLTFILSAETLRQLPTWHEPERLLDACRVAVVPRDGLPLPGADWLREQFPGRADRFDVLAAPRLDVSSTAIRERLAAGRAIRYLVPPAVERYIEDHALYRAPRRPDPSPPRRIDTR